MNKNHEKITKELCWDHTLCFLPDTKEDAILIQKKLLAMGYTLNGKTEAVTDVSLFLKFGLVLKGGEIYYGSTASKDYLLCTLSQFDHGDGPALTAEEQTSLLAEFKKLAMEVANISAKVDKICAEVLPREINKPVLGKSGGNHA